MRTAFHQRPLTWIGAAAGLAVLAGSGVFGGLARRPSTATPTAAPGDVVAAAPWEVSVERVVVIDELDGSYLTDDEANHWLVVVATVTVNDDEPVGEFGIGRAIDLPDIGGLHRDGRGEVVDPEVLIVSDGESLFELNPGVPQQLAFLWEQADVADNPARAEVRVNAATHRRDSYTGLLTWRYDEPTPAAVVAVDIEAG